MDVAKLWGDLPESHRRLRIHIPLCCCYTKISIESVMARLTGLEPEPTDYPGITPGRAALGNALPFRTVIGPCRCIRNHARSRVCKSASALNGTLRHSFWVCTFPVVRQAHALAVQAGFEPAALALTGRRSPI